MEKIKSSLEEKISITREEKRLAADNQSQQINNIRTRLDAEETRLHTLTSQNPSNTRASKISFNAAPTFSPLAQNNNDNCNNLLSSENTNTFTKAKPPQPSSISEEIKYLNTGQNSQKQIRPNTSTATSYSNRTSNLTAGLKIIFFDKLTFFNV